MNRHASGNVTNRYQLIIITPLVLLMHDRERRAEVDDKAGSVVHAAEHTPLNRAVASVFDTLRYFSERLVVRALAFGPLPAHIAFIMDGNRRWSRNAGLKVQDGHDMGFNALRRMLKLCMDLKKVRVVTVYAFAIDNFRRSQDEVDALMELARMRLLELLEKNDVVSQHSIRVRFVGRRSLLPTDVQDVIARVENETQAHTGPLLNICMPYAAQDEICAAMDTCKSNIPLFPADIDAHLMVSRDIAVDMLVRTSNVARLSDFLLWQCNERTQLYFVDRFWPQIDIWDLVPVLLAYQRNCYV